MNKIKPPPIPKKYLDLADKIYDRPSLYRSSYALKLALKNDSEYKKQYDDYLKQTKTNKKPYSINQWFKEKWVNVREYLKGNIVECGSDEPEKFPACRPLIRINKKTPITLPELLDAGVSKSSILFEIQKKEKNPDYVIKWKNLLK